MPITIKVGLAKKIGQPDFGSLGASCDIELEVDGGLLNHDLQGLQERIHGAYVACRQAVNDELASQCHTIKTEPDKARRDGGDNSVARTKPSHESNNGSGTNGHRRSATISQVRALHAIATRQGFNLTDRLKEQFHIFRAEDLSISEASRLIDDLNGTRTSSGTNGSGGSA